MSDGNDPTPPPSNLEKDPDDWVTGDEPMTAAQSSYLQTLAAETGVEVDEDLTKAEASKQIDELQRQSSRLQDGEAAASAEAHDTTSVTGVLDLDDGPDRVIVQQNTGIANMEGSGEWPHPDAEPRGPAPGTVPELRQDIEERRQRP